MVKLKIEYSHTDNQNRGIINCEISEKTYEQVAQLLFYQKPVIVKTYYARFMNNRSFQLNRKEYIKGLKYKR